MKTGMIAMITGLLLMAGCEILDVEPKQSISSETAFTTPAGAQQALLGCYDALQAAGYYGRNFILATELASDNGLATGTILEYKTIVNNAMLADNAVVESIWNAIYTMINRTNNVIRFTPEVKGLTAAQINNINGQARFLRALGHFDLLRLFGDVPLRREPSLSAGPGLNAPRISTTDLYVFILEDLTFAADHITNTQKGMATREAAQALMARIFLYQGEYLKANQMASQVIASSSLSLLNDYGSLFASGSNSEAIFYVDFNAMDKNRLAEYLLPTSMGGRKEVAPSPALINGAFSNPADLRALATIGGAPAEPYIKKYSDLATGTDKVYVMRLAEMYLIRAETEARSWGDMAAIRADIDTLRTRAALPGVNANTYHDLLMEIEMERQREFAFEGHRWFDLCRTGRAGDLKPTITLPCQMLFPIPLSEIFTNDSIKPTDQNPCY